MLRHADALAVTLDDLPLDHADIIAGEPVAGIAELDAFAGVAYGIWELSEGVVRDTEVDEVFVVLAGSGAVEFEAGEVVDLAPGAVVRLLAGERTRWTITQTLRKVWFTPTA